HELNMPGCYRDVTDTTVIAQFEAIKDEKFNTLFSDVVSKDDAVYFLAWTTTPWTLPSNTALTVGKNIDYVLVETFNQYTHKTQKVLLAKNLVGKYFSKDFENSDFNNYGNSGKKIPWRVLKTIKGADLLDLRYEQLLPYAQPYENPQNAFRIISGDF